MQLVADIKMKHFTKQERASVPPFSYCSVCFKKKYHSAAITIKMLPRITVLCDGTAQKRTMEESPHENNI